MADEPVLRKRRPLVLIASLAILAVLLAAIALVVDRQHVSGEIDEALIFPELAHDLPNVTRIVYTVGKGLAGAQKIVLERSGNGRWGVAEKEGYPARQDAVEKALLGIANLKAVETRTANPEWHGQLGLGDPEELGRAVRIALIDDTGTELASLLVGKVPENTLTADGEGLVYVRRSGEDQTWLARGSIPLYPTPEEWVDQTFLALGERQVKRAVLWAGTEKPVILTREGDGYEIANLPEGRISRGSAVLAASATAVTGLTFENVVPAQDFPSEGVAPVAMFDLDGGLRIVVRLEPLGSALWAKVTAEAEAWPETPESAAANAERDAEAINNRVEGWIYRLPTAAADKLTQTMDQLTRAAGEADGAAP